MRKVAAAFLASMAAAGFSTPSPLHRIPDPLSVPKNRGGGANHLQKKLAISGHFGSLRQRLRRHGVLRQWLFHPPVTQARLRHPTPCP